MCIRCAEPSLKTTASVGGQRQPPADRLTANASLGRYPSDPVSHIVDSMTATQAPWFSALAPFVERDDLVVELANPFLTPSGERVDSLPSVFVRFPMWRGAAF